MSTTQNSFFDKLFRNKQGNIVIWQAPNIPLWIWIVSSVLERVFTHGHVPTGLQYVSKASLFTWAYLEIKSGESIARRALGVVVMLGLLYEFFVVS